MTITVNGIDELKGLAGRTLGPSPWREVTQEEIDRFAEVSGDHQWIHVDPERAKNESPFGKTVAHGNLTLSMIDGFRPQLLESSGFKLGVNYGWNKVRFPAPVLSGSRIRGSVETLAGHFSKTGARGSADMVAQIADIEFIATETEAEALLAEQEFIKRYRPLYNVRLRDDKSYPYIGISLDEAFPRIYFTRERHRRNRVYFGPFSNAKRVRETLDLLGKVFQYRTCDGPEPGRASGSPCLDYFIKRCGAPCVGYISKDEYRANVDTIIDFLSGRYRQIERALNQGMKRAADEQEFEQAALLRNRLKAVRSLLERQRIANEAVGTLDAIGVAAEDTDANAQVFQVRDGVLQDRQSFYLENAARRDEGEVAEEFVLQYYASAIAVPPLVVVQRSVERTETLAEALAERRGAPVEVRHAERGDKRRILELAERNARLALDQDRLRSERRRAQRIEALDGLQQALGMEAIPMRIECFDISQLMGAHPVASLIVFDGGKGQLYAGLSELGPFRDLGVTVVSLAKRIEEVFLPGRKNPLVLPHDTAEL